MPRKQDVEYIMIHCLATPFGWRMHDPIEEVVAIVRDWHVRERGWSDLAYAMIIHFNGKRGKGRDRDADGDVWEEVGAGARGWNKNCIHIALNGGKGSTANDKFSDHYTPEQEVALRKTIQEIRDWAGWEVPVIGHNDVAAKACPGFNAKQWFERKPPRRIENSTTIGASVGGAGATVAAGGTAISQLDGDAQILALGLCAIILLAFLWIARERVKKWAKGVH